MKIVDIYGWGLPKQADFLNHFKNNETLYNQARALWSKLDTCTVWFIVAFEDNGKRDDGYHNIVSLMQGIELCDIVKIKKCPKTRSRL